MTLSYYLPGCTGREYEIGGPEREEEGEFDCPSCDMPVVGMIEYHQGHKRGFHTILNGSVEHVGEWEPIDDEPDPDALYDAWRDDR